MVGRELSDLFPPRDAVAGGARRPLLQVQRLQRAGLGRRTRASRCAPARSSASPAWSAPAAPSCSKACWACARAAAAVEIGGRAGAHLRNPRDAADHGLTYLSEDRKGKGLHVHFGLRQNLTLMALERYAQPWLQPEAERGALADGGEGLRHPHRLARRARLVAVGRQPAEARARQGAAAAAARWWCSTSRRAASTSAPSATSIS